MFVVEFEDGSSGVEGTEFQTWNDVPSTKRIAAVSLVAGPEIIETLRGYDKYMVCYEAVTGMKVSVDVGKDWLSTPWDHQPKVVAQKLYGFRRYGLLIRRLQETAGKIMDEIHSAKGMSDEAMVVYDISSQSVKKKMDNVIQQIIDREIKCVSIQVSTQFLSREKAGLNWNLMKEGLADEIVIPSESELKKILLK